MLDCDCSSVSSSPVKVDGPAPGGAPTPCGGVLFHGGGRGVSSARSWARSQASSSRSRTAVRSNSQPQASVSRPTPCARHRTRYRSRASGEFRPAGQPACSRRNSVTSASSASGHTDPRGRGGGSSLQVGRGLALLDGPSFQVAPSQTASGDGARELIHAARRRRHAGSDRHRDARTAAEAHQHDRDNGPAPSASPTGADVHDRSAVTGTPRALARRFRTASEGFRCCPDSRRTR